MAGETIISKLSAIVLEANGAGIASNTIAQANDATYSIFTDGGGRADAKFVFSGSFSSAPTEGSFLLLMARPLNIKGTGDAEAPELARPNVLIGHFSVNNVTTTQYIELLAEDVPWEAEYYIGNSGTGQAVSAGWTLDVIPYTAAPAP